MKGNILELELLRVRSHVANSKLLSVLIFTFTTFTYHWHGAKDEKKSSMQWWVKRGARLKLTDDAVQNFNFKFENANAQSFKEARKQCQYMY